MIRRCYTWSPASGGSVLNVQPRTITTRYEQPVGVWTHVARTATPALAPLMYRELIGFDQEWASFGSWLEAPRPATDTWTSQTWKNSRMTL